MDPAVLHWRVRLVTEAGPYYVAAKRPFDAHLGRTMDKIKLPFACFALSSVQCSRQRVVLPRPTVCARRWRPKQPAFPSPAPVRRRPRSLPTATRAHRRMAARREVALAPPASSAAATPPHTRLCSFARTPTTSPCTTPSQATNHEPPPAATRRSGTGSWLVAHQLPIERASSATNER